MNTENETDSQEGDDRESNGRTPQYDSEREKLLCEWWARWQSIVIQDGDDKIAQQWAATHIKEVVALPHPFERGDQECEIYLELKPGRKFTPPNATWKRFVDFSDRVSRRLQYKEGAHRGYTLDEIPDHGEERYLLDGVIPAAQLSVIYGSPKAGKSAWAHKLAVAVASDSADFDGMPVEHGRVLFVTLDPGARREQVKKRIAAVAERMGCPEIMHNKRIVIVDDPALLDDEDSLFHFLQRNPGKFVLVIIDPLYKALTGGDPSIAGAMNAATEGIKAIIGATGAAVVLLHHATKGGGGGMYGSTFLDAALDARLLVERVKNRVTVTVEVIKNGESPEQPFVYRFEKEFLALDEPPQPKPPKSGGVHRPDMLALIPLTDISRRGARKLVEHLLTGTAAAKDQQWSRACKAWIAAGLVVETGGAIRRVLQQ